jgi:hypothetical protein
VEPCELPDDIQLVYVDDRDRRRTVAIDDAAGIDFGVAKAFRKSVVPSWSGLAAILRSETNAGYP